MRRPLPIATLALLAWLPLAAAQSPEELAQTARFVAAFQNPDGGFAPAVGQASALGPTSSAIRTLKYCGGSIKDVPGCIAYVRSCWDKESGGFSQTPGGQTDCNTTSIGLMAVAELKIADPAQVDKAVAYLAGNAKTFEEVRLAVAGLEAVQKKCPVLDEWKAIVLKDRNPDGTWGQGAGKAFATGSAAVAMLRLGLELDHKAEVLKALRDGQRSDGGWGKDDGPSDFGSSYRIMRCFYMLKEKPDLEGVRKFVARHRQSDGGYAPAPGKPADVSCTYTASIILYWCRLLDGQPAITETAGFVPLFNGQDLTGWEGETSLWSARDGMLVGKSPGIKENQFLATKADYKDFILQLSFRLVNGEGNSGVQFRSVRIPGTEMKGYQADIGQGYWGSLYDESRRNKVLAPASQQALDGLHKDGWNRYVVRAIGNQVRLSLNGVTSVDYREEDPEIAAQGGKIAVQIHGGGPMEVQFKDVYIQPLPSPVADDKATPGFHLRTVKTDGGDRKYTVYLPTKYDGTRTFPVVLFLHGSGERGSDGVVSAQVGLGPSIAGRPADFPVIAVFPQARETWGASSEDAKAALAALDDVLNTFKCDRQKVALTGLSMGGRGAWEMAAAHPDRFIAVAPICGPGRPDDSKVYKALPVWSFVGDNDREATVLNLRTMNEAIKKEGGKALLTEYRNVGHNSWDRAYSDPALMTWMLEQDRKARP
jgi:poly(3-hydroxybutyrate) depolymerase/prenyltransferase beta subunit